MQKVLNITETVDITHVDAHVSKTKSRDNNVRILCSLTFSVLCSVFMHASFL